MPNATDAQSPRLDADGRERPAFIFDYPQHERELNELVKAFELGNFLQVRRKAGPLADRASDPAVKKAALDLLRRTRPDPLILLFLLSSLLLFTFLAAWSYL